MIEWIIGLIVLAFCFWLALNEFELEKKFEERVLKKQTNVRRFGRGVFGAWPDKVIKSDNFKKSLKDSKRLREKSK